MSVTVGNDSQTLVDGVAVVTYAAYRTILQSNYPSAAITPTAAELGTGTVTAATTLNANGVVFVNIAGAKVVNGTIVKM